MWSLWLWCVVDLLVLGGRDFCCGYVWFVINWYGMFTLAVSLVIVARLAALGDFGFVV